MHGEPAGWHASWSANAGIADSRHSVTCSKSSSPQKNAAPGTVAMTTAVSENFSRNFGDSSYLTQEGDILVETLPEDLHALLTALIRRDCACSQWIDTDGLTLDWDAFNAVLSGSGYLPFTHAPH